MDSLSTKTDIMFWISITIEISIGIDWIQPRLESMRNEVNNDYYDLVVEIDDLIMKQSEKGWDHCRFEGK